MDVVILLVFISLVLVGCGLSFFIYRLKEGDFDHGDRLALTPLADDEEPAAVGRAEPKEPSSNGSDGSAAVPAEYSETEGGTPHVES